MEPNQQRVTVKFSAEPQGPRHVRHVDHPGLLFTLTLAPGGDVRALTIECEKDAPALTARTLHRIPLGELRGAASADIATRLAHRHRASRPGTAEAMMVEAANASADARLADWTSKWQANPRPGPKGRDDADYAEIARAYVELLGERRPIPALAQKMAGQRKNVSVAQARNLVYEARKRGLLTPVSAGRAGGELTPKALDLLKENDRGSR